jgi:ubiquinone/menaquinone biosynthesis C-methylase UbiE
MGKNKVDKGKNVECFDFDHPSFWFVMEDKIKRLLGCSLFYGPDIKSLGLKGDESVLDFGCGGGPASLCLMKHLDPKGRLLGVDTSAYWIDIARERLKKYPNAKCTAGDIRTMTIPEHSKDVVVAIHVIHHIAQADRPAIIMALSRLLKKEGRLLIRERSESSHSIRPIEIRSLLSNSGMKEVTCNLSKSEYRGIFMMDSDVT